MYKDSKKRHVQARSHRTGRCQVSARASIKSSALLQGRRGSSPVSVSLSRWSEAFPWNRGSSWTSFPARPRCRHLTRLSPKTQKQQVPLHHSKPQFKKVQSLFQKDVHRDLSTSHMAALGLEVVGFTLLIIFKHGSSKMIKNKMKKTFLYIENQKNQKINKIKGWTTIGPLSQLTLPFHPPKPAACVAVSPHSNTSGPASPPFSC